MKKFLVFTLAVLFTPIISNAGFETRSDVIDKRQALEEEKLQRDIEQTKATQETAEELKKANAINAEIAAKLDVLIESSKRNNELLETLLLRTQE